MRIIKLNAIDSTNSFLRKLNKEKPVDDYTVVIADYQTKGRGQMGTHWQSQQAKNLMFSVFKSVSNLNIESHFYISMAVSLAVYRALKAFHISALHIKWPNDILSEQLKISGILIENVIKKNQLQSTIIGVGINVNQTAFKDLPKATSMSLVTGQCIAKDEVLDEVLKQMVYYLSLIEEKSLDLLKQEYEDKLFRKDKPSTFRDLNNNLFTGFIKGVSNTGHLQVLVEDNITKSFDFKEIQLLY